MFINLEILKSKGVVFLLTNIVPAFYKFETIHDFFMHAEAKKNRLTRIRSLRLVYTGGFNPITANIHVVYV